MTSRRSSKRVRTGRTAGRDRGPGGRAPRPGAGLDERRFPGALSAFGRPSSGLRHEFRELGRTRLAPLDQHLDQSEGLETDCMPARSRLPRHGSRWPTSSLGTYGLKSGEAADPARPTDRARPRNAPSTWLIPATTSSTCGSTSRSSEAAYGIGVSFAVTRTGAERSASNASSSDAGDDLAGDAARPRGLGDDDEPAGLAHRLDDRVRGRAASACAGRPPRPRPPSRASCRPACSARWTPCAYATTVTSPPSRLTSATPIGTCTRPPAPGRDGCRGAASRGRRPGCRPGSPP